MKKAKLITASAVITIGLGTFITAYADQYTVNGKNNNTPMQPMVKTDHEQDVHHKCTMHKKWKGAKFNLGNFVKYGPITPGKTWVALPAGATPGSRAECWSRDLAAGRIQLGIPGYGNVNLTPNNPLGVFAVPNGDKFSVNYTVGRSGFFHNIFGMFGSRSNNQNYGPARLTCHFY